MRETPVLRLGIREAGDTLDDEGGRLLGDDRLTLDAALTAAMLHVHDGSTNALGDLTDPPTAEISEDEEIDGHLPPSITLWYQVTRVDSYGRQSAPSPPAEVTLPDPIETPGPPTVTWAPTGGTHPSGTYNYGVSAYTDGDTNRETVAGNVSSIHVPTGTLTNSIDLELPELPDGADGFNIYRLKPGGFDYVFLDSVVGADTYVDDNSTAEDPNRRFPAVSTANLSYAIELEFPDELDEGQSWKVYRTDIGDVWTDTFLHHVVEETTEGSGITTTTFIDDGSFPPSPGSPPPSGVSVLPNPQQVDLEEHVTGTLPLANGGTGATMYQELPDAHDGLTFAYGAGRVRGKDGVFDTAAGTVDLADDDVSYIEVNADGVVSDNTTGFTDGFVPLYEVTAVDGAITAVVDRRAFLAAGGGSVMRAVSAVYVAASDAPQWQKDLADHVCDGTDDQVEIQAALDVITEGQTVALSEGTFAIDDSLTIASTADYGRLLGVFTDRPRTFFDINSYSGTAVITSSATGFTFEGIGIYDAGDGLDTGHAMMRSTSGRIKNCNVENYSVDGTVLNGGWTLHNAILWGADVIDGHIGGADYAITAIDTVIDAENGYAVRHRGSTLTLEGCTISAYGAGQLIRCESPGSNGITIERCQINDSGITITSGSAVGKVKIAGNRIDGAATPMVLDRVHDGMIVHNVIEGTATPAVDLDNAERNTILGNKFIGGPTVAIDLAATTEDNFVVVNDIGVSGVTDAGTNNTTTP